MNFQRTKHIWALSNQCQKGRYCHLIHESDFAKINKAVLAGLEYRVKSPKSLYNKLYQRIEKSFFDSIADVIRYTVILEPKENVEQIRSVTDALYEKNWKIYSLKNYWVNDSFPYNGVNAKFKNSRNYRIEIQFHTQLNFF